MKAIQVKFMSMTNTKPARLKVFTDHQQLIISTHDERLDINSIKCIEQQAAEILANNWFWLSDNDRLVGGQIKNGDHVFVIVEKELK